MSLRSSLPRRPLAAVPLALVGLLSACVAAPDDPAPETIGASHGDALMAAIGVGLVPAETTWMVPARTVHPDPATRAAYDELYAAFLELYPAVRPVLHTLASLQDRAATTGRRTPRLRACPVTLGA